MHPVYPTYHSRLQPTPSRGARQNKPYFRRQKQKPMQSNLSNTRHPQQHSHQKDTPLPKNNQNNRLLQLPQLYPTKYTRVYRQKYTTKLPTPTTNTNKPYRQYTRPTRNTKNTSTKTKTKLPTLPPTQATQKDLNPRQLNRNNPTK